MSTFIRLTDYKSSDEKEEGFFKAKNRYVAKQEDFEKIPMTPIAFWMSKSTWKLFKENQILDNFTSVKRGPSVESNQKYIRRWSELNKNSITINVNNINNINFDTAKWFLCNKTGGSEKWYAKTEDALLFVENNSLINISNKSLMLKESIVWSDGKFGSNKFAARLLNQFQTLESTVNFIQTNELIKILGYLNCKVAEYFLNITIEGQHFSPIYVKNIPFNNLTLSSNYINVIQECIDISKEEWDSRETSWDFKTNELIRFAREIAASSSTPRNDIKLETVYNRYCEYWREKFYKLHKNEEELNRLFIDIYELNEELTPDLDLKDITILKSESIINDNNELEFRADEIMKQFISYGVGVLFGRYNLDHEGLHVANMHQSLVEANASFNISSPSFEADEDNIIPVLEDDYFKDDITARFIQFVKVAFGEASLHVNIRFIENALGMSLRKYFVKGFYEDHIKRYKKRPIYWMVSSPKKGFMSLSYMHRYESDLFGRVRNSYLGEYITKLEAHKESLEHTINSSSATDKDKKDADKRIKEIEVKLKELIAFDREKMMHFAQQHTEIDLDDGVKVNYTKFQDILFPIAGLSDEEK